MDLFSTLEIIFKVILAGLLGSVCALFTYFLDYCFWDGSIFENYLPWLAKKIVKAFDPKAFDLISKLPLDAQKNEFLNHAPEFFIYKPLGGCAVCMNVYIAAISYALMSFLSSLEWYYFPVYILVSSAVLRKFVKATY